MEKALDLSRGEEELGFLYYSVSFSRPFSREILMDVPVVASCFIENL